MADKYCCFLHPKKDYALKELEDPCPDCNMPYGFPLEVFPRTIRSYTIEKSAGRGFYGVTYRALAGRFGEPKAIKVIPKSIYEFFEKDFEAECQSHYELAQNTEHLAPIEDYFDEEIAFGETVMPCHVAVMKWVEGDTLFDMVTKKKVSEASVAAQIALDLLSLLDELQRGGKRHNDLHDKNIIVEYNENAPQRTDRIHRQFRAIAVDFGSIDDASLSGDSRAGDLENVGHHIRSLTHQIRNHPASESDLNWRLAFALDQTARSLLRAPTSQRLSFSDLRSEIETLAIHRAKVPVWRSSLELKSLSEHYNAQTIESAYVPNLLVLPHDSTWSDQVQSPGPQVISGMRGCGKTMLLKSLDFHARAFRSPQEASSDVVARLKKERFVGLFLACAKLLDQTSSAPNNLHVRLLVGYALSALRISQHLRDLDRDLVDPRFPTYILSALEECLSESLEVPESISEFNLEELLVRTQLRLAQEDYLQLKSSPSNVFPVFAGVFGRISPAVFGEAHVLYLLDDVSTRFISKETISELISALLFSSEKCSFKFTTEAQTLELVLRSPGRIEKANQGRDYTVFNLGSEISRLIRGKGNSGKKFVSDVLQKRGKYLLREVRNTPVQILGDQYLSTIATSIGKAFEQPEGRKKIYWGLSAVTNLCVGDVGEVIRLYEDILKQSQPGNYPVPPETQHKCFQHLCTSALHDVNRQDTKLKDHAIGFANAAHKLLRKSLSNSSGGSGRIRQYAQVYVSISKGNQGWIFDEIRQLIDAGIYTLDAATAAPRTKRVNADPVQQFILTYRKLYGLSTLIGLAYRDRFELSGEDLENWLRNPANAEDIFLRNEGGVDEEAESEESLYTEDNAEVSDDSGEVKKTTDPAADGGQMEMALWPDSGKIVENEPVLPPGQGLKDLGIVLERFELSDLPRIDLVISGAGIEERSEASLQRILNSSRPSKVHLVRYPMPGRTTSICQIISDHGITPDFINSKDSGDWEPPSGDSELLVDLSGLAKPEIFHFCRKALARRKSLLVCHTEAEGYFPSDSDIEPILSAHSEDDIAKLLEKMAEVFKGESKPYQQVGLVDERQDDSRPRSLISFASAKHERLLSLLDGRYYDYVGIGYSSADTLRGKISEMAARFAVRNLNEAACFPVSPTGLEDNIDFLVGLYSDLYYRNGYNVEIGLTGSKMCGLATAVLAARWKIAQAWYVKPASYSKERFTTGVGHSQVLRISLSDEGDVSLDSESQEIAR